MNNLYQEAQRDDWHGQIVPRLWEQLPISDEVKKYTLDGESLRMRDILDSM